MTTPGWAPVVYGRTRTVDRWWRALPAGVEPDWVAGVVRVVTADGIGLDERPRFILAQGRRHRLVGGATRASALSATMNTDGRRALYCFVGWVSAREEASEAVPALDELEAGFAAWAAPVYEHWMAKDWDLHETQVAGPHVSEAERAPWPSVRPPAHALPPAAAGRAPLAWPEDRADEAWDLVRASDAPGLLVAGWQHASDAELRAGGWIAAADVARVTVLARPASPEPEAPRAAKRPASQTRASQPPLTPALSTPAETDVEALIRQTWNRVGHMPAPAQPPASVQPEAEDDDDREPAPRQRGEGLLGRVFRAVIPPPPPEPEAGDSAEPCGTDER